MEQNIQIPKTKFETCIEVLSFVLLCGIFIYVFFMWSELPERIPSHFDGMGRPDGWSGKESILILPIVGLLLFFLLYMLGKASQLFNYSMNVSEEKAPKLYAEGRRLMIALNIEISFFFFIATWKEVQTAIGKADGLGSWFLISFIVILFVTLIVYIIRFRRV
ncbi:DUF1648 domain-containing protein [Bacillus pseudomycoides]|uniref:DUF1648 domain-containing protein n=1 Tax=Bacillus pseudomycoides TaxID=64104 RepID=UPI000BEC496C|nr:DUF1648 domain-containing protein [Bacillus pseudomycoides]PEE40849.1 hypothetical protein COO02_14110 [Bacillus pseudomycoides]PEI92959.1 hypothetical protein CN679_09330 [Bacillus pseudomycoides]PGA90961.1 hypothetical protein COL91_11955 [Bacillus pseudomycoides]PHF47044.1 hypothetical protein COF72_11495 [Bacillus pseudomycoides]